MNVIDWLCSGDPIIKRLTQVHLLEQKIPYSEEGYIEKYIGLYDQEHHLFGGGVYSPKWISTHYTMLELKYMEIDPMHQIYQDALKTLIDNEWKTLGIYRHDRHQDMCVVGMLLSLVTYGKLSDQRIHEMIDYILDHIMLDGGWNCAWERKPAPKISSVHTTLSILEALRDYESNGYTYRINEVKIAMLNGIACLLKRNLYQAHQQDEPIHHDMIKPSYPPRWKYDILKALEFLASVSYPDDLRLNQAMNLLIKQMHGPLMLKGSQIPGKLHFQLESGRYGMFNTLRILKVLKFYRRPLYERLIKQTI
jgi:hypothetical protein